MGYATNIIYELIQNQTIKSATVEYAWLLYTLYKSVHPLILKLRVNFDLTKTHSKKGVVKLLKNLDLRKIW